MVGIRTLVCREFVETDDYAKSRAELLERTGLTIQDLDDRLEALEWALARGDTEDEISVQPVPGRTIWVAVIPRGYPPLRVYLRPCTETEHRCEWLWIEERYS
jgi:hypothetical protein